MNWHILNIDETFRLLKSGIQGLSPQEAAVRFQEHGPNEIEQGKKKSLVVMFLDQFKDFMILVLIAAAVVSGVLGDLTDTAIIVAILVLNAIIGFVQEYRAEKAIESLRQMAASSASVIRHGENLTIPASELVPGDVVMLTAGNIAPADIRFIEVHSISVNEASLTGESVPVDKNNETIKDADIPLGDRFNMAYKGTHIVNGRALGVVVATGSDTELGKIARMLGLEDTQTPLQKRLSAFGKNLALIVLAICIVVFVAGLIRGEDLWLMLLLSISLAVAAIPEALPAVVSISLALGARRLVKENALIRKLPAVETLGSVTYICTDKTGTLTQNKMQVQEICTDTIFTMDNVNALRTHPNGTLLLEAMAISNDVTVNPGGGIEGDSTEVAFYEAAQRGNIIKDEVLTQKPRIAELPFDSIRKRMSTIHALDGDREIIFCKGAVENIIDILNEEEKGKAVSLNEQASKMAADGLRVLAFAYAIKPRSNQPPTIETTETNLQFLGLCGLMDPPREEAAQAVKECKTAGIIPVMITGDHPLTALAIARKIGIVSSMDEEVVTGKQLDEWDEKTYLNHVEKIRVYARVTPEQKLTIVNMLQRKGHFVAMTGDGVNDAPALKKAEIGVAMGITGTDVAKEVAHLILLDDNFATIVRAVREGRRIFDNIRKFIKYTMTSNSAEIITIVVAPFLGLPIPLLPIHILWINLVTDGLPGLALGVEPAEDNIMNRPPRKPDENIFAHGMGFHIVWAGMLLGALSIATQWASINYGIANWQSMVFTVLCLGQMAHLLSIRTEGSFLNFKNIATNKPLLVAVAATFLLQMATLYVPFLNSIFRTQPLSLKELAISLGLAACVFIAVETEKFTRNWRAKAILK